MEAEDYKKTDTELERDLRRYDQTNFDSLIKQVDTEYNLCLMNQHDRIATNLTHLKLYNNQRKDKDAVGDLTLFTTQQTVLSSLYDDMLACKFVGREKGDEDKADNITALAEFDYTKMEKNVLDYTWDWDTLFFGGGLIEMLEFNRDKEFLCPSPNNLDPMTFLHDPKAIWVNGLMNGKGKMRFGGYELWLTKKELGRDNGYFNTKWLRGDNEIRSLLRQAQQERENAQNLQYTFNKDMESNLGDNALTAGLKWFTQWKGKKCMVVLAQGRRRVIKYKELENQKAWPIIHRKMYPHSHDWYSTTIPDLTEDKQRQKSVAINLGLQAMKADLYPMYLYDEDRVKNKSDLLNFAFNKFVGIHNTEGKDVGNVVRPLNKANIRWDMVNFVLNTLDASAQKATATPDMQTGSIDEQKRTLGELNLVSSKVDVRYSLSAKVFGWSEKEFWRQWYWRYKENFVKDVDEKVIRLVGVQGYSYRPLMRDNFITGLEPDVEIESKALSEAKQMRERLLFQSFGQAIFAEPTANKRYYLTELSRLNGLKKDQIDLLLPPTVDELLAQKENESLNKNKLVPVNPNDDHTAHLMEHNTAEETAAKQAHIEAHIEALRIQRDQPELFPQLAEQQAAEGQPGQAGQNLGGLAQMVSRTQGGPAPQPSQSAAEPLA